MDLDSTPLKIKHRRHPVERYRKGKKVAEAVLPAEKNLIYRRF